MILYYRLQLFFVFIFVCDVIPFTGGGERGGQACVGGDMWHGPCVVGRGSAWQGVMCGRGGVCGRGHAWQVGCMAGMCVGQGVVHGSGGDMHGRGCVWWGACMAGGMHPCLHKFKITGSWYRNK